MEPLVDMLHISGLGIQHLEAASLITGDQAGVIRAEGCRVYRRLAGRGAENLRAVLAVP